MDVPASIAESVSRTGDRAREPKRTGGLRVLLSAGLGLLVLMLAAAATLLEPRLCRLLSLSPSCALIPRWFYDAAFAVFYLGCLVSVIALLVDVWRVRKRRE